MYTTELKKVLAHRRAFFRVAKSLGVSRRRFLLHDLDKVFLLILPEKAERKLHRLLNKHHVECIFGFDPLEAVIDWECARFTKPDKPLNARQTLDRFYPEYKDVVEPILEELSL